MVTGAYVCGGPPQPLAISYRQVPELGKTTRASKTPVFPVSFAGKMRSSPVLVFRIVTAGLP
jgi:hypothetical protein